MSVSVLSEYIPQRDLASDLGVTERTLQRWARQRSGPPVTKIGGRPFYRRESVRAWIAQREERVEPVRSRRSVK